ncbi:MAG: hypothetical protein AAF750_00015 [Planctomycetota bacterium]
MKKTQTACAVLSLTAAFLGGMVVMRALQAPPATAEASQVLFNQRVTLMTAATGNGDSLFVLDNASGRMAIYTADARKFELIATQDFSKIAGN